MIECDGSATVENTMWRLTCEHQQGSRKAQEGGNFPMSEVGLDLATRKMSGGGIGWKVAGRQVYRPGCGKCIAQFPDSLLLVF